MKTQPLFEPPKLNKSIDARVDEAKLYLRRLVCENMSDVDDGAIAIALLEMAVDRFIQRYGAPSASSYIATIFRKTVNNNPHALAANQEVWTICAQHFNLAVC